jgi:uncharacterized protein (TIGR02145 family)
MKTRITVKGTLLIFAVPFILLSCRKEGIKLLPEVELTNLSSISTNSANCIVKITSDGGAELTSRGICWSTNLNPTISDNKIESNSTSNTFTITISGLNPVTTYYIKAYAINSVGTAYSDKETFTTLAALPSIITTEPTDITSSCLNCGGSITYDGGAQITERGVCWSTNQNPTIEDSKSTNGSGTGNFTCYITGLIPSVTYYIRSYATNSVGTAYGEQFSFTTNINFPILTSANIVTILATSAVSGGSITSEGGSPVTARGVCWSTSENPTTANNKTVDGNGSADFKSSMTGLLPEVTYYLRAYATNSYGTSYGDQKSFTSALPDVQDADGNVYHTVRVLNNRVWMVENLKVTKYANGDPIPNITDGSQWVAATSGGWCNYNNDPLNGDTYGRLYNWYAVNDSRGIAPSGWHVPTREEWGLLYQRNIDHLKETGTVHWESPNSYTDNSSGFTALPGGRRISADFSDIRYYSYWWCSGVARDDPNIGRYEGLCYNTWAYNSGGASKFCGFSVRLIHD